MDERYLEPVKGGRWAISRWVEGRWLGLIQDSYLDDEGDAEVVLRALNLEAIPKNLDRYFPTRGRQGRCPTLELLELYSRVGTEIKKEHGV